jgi:hypothetical protein
VAFCSLTHELNSFKRGDDMHEVKVYDSSGKLKKVISTRSLNNRSNKQLETPSLFLKNKRGRKAAPQIPKPQQKAETA